MTTIALNKGFSAATAIVNPIVNFFEGFGKAVIMARGAEANYKIAEDLRHEYPDMSVPAIAAMLNDRLRKEVYGD
jgi:hypothetical protein